jgi:hypothetical protein
MLTQDIVGQDGRYHWVSINRSLFETDSRFSGLMQVNSLTSLESLSLSDFQQTFAETISKTFAGRTTSRAS